MLSLPQKQTIPDFYCSWMLRYIIYVSRAFAHAHKHDLVHGKFNLSKVSVQQPFWYNPNGTDDDQLSSVSSKSDASSGQNEPQYHHYFVTSFEPWTVHSIMHKYSKDPYFKHLFKCIKAENMQHDWDKYAQVVKMMDLWAFGNSI